MDFFRDNNMGAMVVDDNSYSMVFAGDGSTVTTTRPINRQFAMGAYSGYKGQHCAAVVCVSSVCGLVVATSRVHGGHDNDITVMENSAFNAVLNDGVLRARLLADPVRPDYIIACDSIFSETTYRATTTRIHASAAERQRSKALSAFRVQIEHSFTELKSYFKKLKFGDGLRWGQQVVEPIIIISILLSNCRLCLERRSQTSGRFVSRVPTLAEYLDATHDAYTNNLLNSCL